MLSISVTDEWRAVHPGAMIGLLEVSGVDNSHPSHRLDEKKRLVETSLREKYQGYSRQGFQGLPVMTLYVRYYKYFNKTYHVLLQLESIVLKGKCLPNVSPLVDANFAAEMDTLVLTAGHDIDKLKRKISFDVSKEGDLITQLNGETKAMRPGDMVMRDDGGVCCSIIYGQDDRSPITFGTTRALYVSYAPLGIPEEGVELQLTKD